MHTPSHDEVDEDTPLSSSYYETLHHRMARGREGKAAIP